jgi:hypothetical protein
VFSLLETVIDSLLIHFILIYVEKKKTEKEKEEEGKGIIQYGDGERRLFSFFII